MNDSKECKKIKVHRGFLIIRTEWLINASQKFFQNFPKKKRKFQNSIHFQLQKHFQPQKNTFTKSLSVKPSGTGIEPVNSEIINTRSTQLEKSLNFTKFPSLLFVKIQLLKNEKMNKEMSGLPDTLSERLFLFLFSQSQNKQTQTWQHFG